MEVTAAERTTIYTNISPLAQRVNNYIQTQHSSIAAVAKDIGYSRTTVSRYLTGKYDSNPNDLESKLTDFLTRQTGEAVDLTTPLAKSEGKTWQTPVFFESRDAKAVLGVCQSCQEYIGLGIVVARSGYGKTYALRQYAKLSRVAYIECDDTMSSRDLVEAIERSIGLPNGYGTIWRRVNGIREFFNTNKGYLLIIDEADKLVSKYTQENGDPAGGVRSERRGSCDRGRAETGGADQDLSRAYGEPGRLLRLAAGPLPLGGGGLSHGLPDRAGGAGGVESAGVQYADRVLPTARPHAL